MGLPRMKITREFFNHLQVYLHYFINHLQVFVYCVTFSLIETLALQRDGECSCGDQ